MIDLKFELNGEEIRVGAFLGTMPYAVFYEDTMPAFLPFDVLLPKKGVSPLWPVIACDQFTSEPEYWKIVQELVGTSDSTLHLVFPEVWLGKKETSRIEDIQQTMSSYLKNGIFQTSCNSFVYVERVLSTGKIRRGIVGTVDLEQYEFTENSSKPIRATEKTVRSRIPPRVAIRKGAALELSHVLLLADDPEDRILSPLERKKESLPLLYDVDLMQGGGRLRGYLVAGNEAAELTREIENYERERRENQGESLLYCVGDGNHSLATAKTCYEAIKATLPADQAEKLPARYAMVELGNIRDASLEIEPIHRLVCGIDPEILLHQLQEKGGAEHGHSIQWVSGEKTGTLVLDRKLGTLPIGVLQGLLDQCLTGTDATLDYIHGEASLKKLTQDVGKIGFLLPKIEKSDIFRGVGLDGVLPRKTFSMGEATDKRYYVEARKILR